jgi:hypothetical protein
MNLWTPAEIATQLWLDASDSDTITIDTGVSQWNDKSGNGLHAVQASVSLQPSISSNFLNGLDVLNFPDNGGHALQGQSFSNNEISIFVVRKCNSSGTAYSNCVFDSGDNLSFGSSNGVRFDSFSGTSRFGTNTTFLSGTSNIDWNLIAGIKKSGERSLQLNSVSESSDTQSGDLTQLSSKYSIGTFQTDSSGTLDTKPFYGYIAEIVILPIAVDVETKNYIEGYLAHKWGLEGSLPAEHPYKLQAPFLPFAPSLVPSNKKFKLLIDTSQITADQLDFPVTIPINNSTGKNNFDASLVFDELISENNKKLSIESLAKLTYGNDEYTKLLIHSDSTDGSTSFADSSSSNHAIAVNGDVHHEVDQKKFGATSIYFDGTGDYLSVPASDDFNFGLGDFTIDFWCNTSSFDNKGIFSLTQSTDRTLTLHFSSFGGIKINVHNISAEVKLLSLNTFYHIAVVVLDSVLYVYIDGIQEYSKNVSVLDFNTGTSGLWIGDYYNTTYTLDGYIDEFRISKGIARWTANFTPPSSSYTIKEDMLVQCPVEIESWEDNINADFIYPPAYTSTYTKASTTYSSTFNAEYATNPNLTLVGDGSNSMWLSESGTRTNQKFSIDLGSKKYIGEFDINNAHSNGTAVEIGIKNFTLYGTNSSAAFNNTDYSNVFDLTVLGVYQARVHVESNVADPETFIIEDNDTSYRYYILRIADSWEHSSEIYMGIFHLEFREVVLASAVLHTKIPLIKNNTELVLSVDNSQSDNIDYVGDIGDDAAKEVWNDNFVAVHHMAQSSGDLIDSSGTGNDLTFSGTRGEDGLLPLSNNTISIVGGNMAYMANNTSIQFTDNITIEKILSHSSFSGWVTCSEKGYDASYAFKGNNTLKARFQFNSAGDSSVTFGPHSSGYRYVAATYNGDDFVSYDNGTQIGLVINASDSIKVVSDNYVLGRLSQGLSYVLDELRLSKVARSADWIALTNQSLTDDLITWENFLSGSAEDAVGYKRPLQLLPGFPKFYRMNISFPGLYKKSNNLLPKYSTFGS